MNKNIKSMAVLTAMSLFMTSITIGCTSPAQKPAPKTSQSGYKANITRTAPKNMPGTPSAYNNVKRNMTSSKAPNGMTQFSTGTSKTSQPTQNTMPQVLPNSAPNASKNTMPNKTPYSTAKNSGIAGTGTGKATAPISPTAVPKSTVNVVPNTAYNQSLTSRANKMAEAATQVSGVNRSVVVISGNTALIGVQTNGMQNTATTNTIKNNVIGNVKASDRIIRNVYVTADPSIYTRLTNLSSDIVNGKPVAGLTREISAITARLKPVGAAVR